MKKGNRSFHYLTNCTESSGSKIRAMTDSARQITYETFIQHVPVSELKELFPWYTWDGVDGGLYLKNDYAASFWKGTYDGKPCYYVEQSCIEYVFTEVK